MMNKTTQPETDEIAEALAYSALSTASRGEMAPK